MTQPLSGESSVLGICFISDGFFLIQQRKEQRARSKERGAGTEGSSRSMSRSRGLNAGFAIGGAETDGFLRKIVAGADETDGAAFCAHQNRMGDGGCAL